MEMNCRVFIPALLQWVFNTAFFIWCNHRYYCTVWISIYIHVYIEQNESWSWFNIGYLFLLNVLWRENLFQLIYFIHSMKYSIWNKVNFYEKYTNGTGVWRGKIIRLAYLTHANTHNSGVINIVESYLKDVHLGPWQKNVCNLLFIWCCVDCRIYPWHTEITLGLNFNK